MTARELLRAAHAAENIDADDAYLEKEKHRLIGYIIEGNASVRFKHDYSITQEMIISGGRIRFDKSEPFPAWGRIIVTQNGEALHVTQSRGEEQAFIIAGGTDGLTTVTFQPFPRIPENLDDPIDVPQEYIREVLISTAVRIRLFKSAYSARR
jgi:hypothetical protein